MASYCLFINTDAAKSMVEVETSAPHKWANGFMNFFRGLKAGIYPSSIEMVTSATALVRASGTCTVASIQADDTITINGTTITGKASPSGESQFDSDGSDTVVATAVAACINAHSDLTGLVTATSSGAVVTISAAVMGKIGNCITLASSNGTRLAVSAARLASGAGMDGSAVSYSLGK
jgi:phage tail sheath gpL-like